MRIKSTLTHALGLMIGLSIFCPVWATGLRKKVITPAASFSAHFTESRTLPGFKQPLVSSGQVIYSRKAGISWEVDTPYHYLLKMTSTGAEEQMPDGSIQWLKAKNAPWLEIVQHIFINTLTGHISSLKPYFNVHVTRLKGTRLMILTPKPGALSKAIKTIDVTESSLATPKFLRIDETSGGYIAIRFFDIRLVPKMP